MQRWLTGNHLVRRLTVPCSCSPSNIALLHILSRLFLTCPRPPPPRVALEHQRRRILLVLAHIAAEHHLLRAPRPGRGRCPVRPPRRARPPMIKGAFSVARDQSAVARGCQSSEVQGVVQGVVHKDCIYICGGATMHRSVVSGYLPTYQPTQPSSWPSVSMAAPTKAIRSSADVAAYTVVGETNGERAPVPYRQVRNFAGPSMTDAVGGMKFAHYQIMFQMQEKPTPRHYWVVEDEEGKKTFMSPKVRPPPAVSLDTRVPVHRQTACSTPCACTGRAKRRRT